MRQFFCLLHCLCLQSKLRKIYIQKNLYISIVLDRLCYVHLVLIIYIKIFYKITDINVVTRYYIISVHRNIIAAFDTHRCRCLIRMILIHFTAGCLWSYNCLFITNNIKKGCVHCVHLDIITDSDIFSHWYLNTVLRFQITIVADLHIFKL